MKILLLILLTCFVFNAGAQTPADSLRLADSLRVIDSLQRFEDRLADSLSKLAPPIRDSIRPQLGRPMTSDSFRFYNHPFFGFTNPVRYTISEKRWEGKEAIFYSVIGLLILFAVIKNTFPRYLSDLFSTYFRTTVRQRQIKEQLLQSPLPSLLFNIFFVLSGALFASLLFHHFGTAVDTPYWLLALYSAVALALIYGGKFVLLKFFGWVFQFKQASEVYIFVVFSTNKILGILFLPFIVLLAFSSGQVNASAVTLSLIVVVCLFLYRFFLAYTSVNRMVPLTVFHFLLYLAAFEILPLLLINKLLFLFLSEIS